jgi:adenosylcobinamide-phosphate synthase
VSVLLAALIDRWWGEPPVAVHPVVWMGRYLGWAGRALPALRAPLALILGACCWLAGATVVALLYALAGRALTHLPPWAQALLTAVLLKPLFALRMLLDEVRAVEHSLQQSLEAGRGRLAAIVSRDTTALTADEVREASLESLAENLSDSVIAPLFWFVVLGLPGAAIYRFANTADAMWGYRGRWEWAGKFAARVDDVLNIVPARLTALALLLTRSHRWRLLRALPAEAGRTRSPNSGWPMAALALGLDVCLRKPSSYALNASGRAPTPTDFEVALHLTTLTAWALIALFSIARQVLPNAL